MDLGDRMKTYEDIQNNVLCPGLPVIARLDGRSFHSFTRKFPRPFYPALTVLMQESTEYLLRESHAILGYTQSDEISLLFHTDNHDGEIFFNGKIQKMVSVLAAILSAYFNANRHVLGSNIGLAHFDCRVFTVPSKDEAVNYFIWRERDAIKNAVDMAAHTVYSNAELFKKTTSDKHEMLFQKGINWNDYPRSFKMGSYLKKVSKEMVNAAGTKFYRGFYEVVEMSLVPRPDNAMELVFGNNNASIPSAD